MFTLGLGRDFFEAAAAAAAAGAAAGAASGDDGFDVLAGAAGMKEVGGSAARDCENFI
jgi:hypothetical protein